PWSSPSLMFEQTTDLSPDGARLAARLQKNEGVQVWVWDAETGHSLYQLQGFGKDVHTLRFSLDGRRLLTSDDDGSARVWDAADGRLLLTLAGHPTGVTRAEFSPDGKRVLTLNGGQSSNDGVTAGRVWDAADGRKISELKWPKPGSAGLVDWAAFSPDGRRV